ncbi:MAG: hypothetical protein JSC161_000710 [Candidatus Tokpelaia sp. JSC161]|nr:MAG: hypothetical protein JSC161_000710 [Candidatus Tokpelaia sp. JSC161]
MEYNPLRNNIRNLHVHVKKKESNLPLDVG